MSFASDHIICFLFTIVFAGPLIWAQQHPKKNLLFWRKKSPVIKYLQESGYVLLYIGLGVMMSESPHISPLSFWIVGIVVGVVMWSIIIIKKRLAPHESETTPKIVE